MEFWESDNVLLEGVTLKDPAFWTVHPVYSSNVVVRRLKIESPLDMSAPNTDGVDPNSCVNVTIVDSHFNTETKKSQSRWVRELLGQVST